MRQVLASVLLLGTLTGCLGQFKGEHIEAAYHRCLDEFRPLKGIQFQQWEAMCEQTRRAAYDYRLSVRRFVPQFPSSEKGGATGYRPPTQVIIMP
jgi:hypothetical protein